MSPTQQLGNLALIASAGIFLIAAPVATGFACTALATGVLAKYALSTLHRRQQRHRRRRRRR